MSMKCVNAGEFNAVLTAVARESRRTGEQALNYAMILMLTAGRNKTPLGKKNRALQTVEKGQALRAMQEGGSQADIADAAAMSGRQFFDVYYQGSSAPRQMFLPRVRKMKVDSAQNAENKRVREKIIAQFREIAFRGTAKASFGWAMWKATGTRGKDLGKRMIRRQDPITVQKQLNGTNPYIEVTNALGWINKLVPGIEQQMVDSATNRMNAWLEKRWQTGIDKAQRAAS
jgi:hypothetical protein